eukprot:comp23949_c0_seq2/m.42368 comp23949_c0_seq2/g.42368  ORF comp23949_c0_seq2/g.42368 comp23949_c0_seq2/m.42368 type:complete len:680 (-) comp23949_c0_seq2:335-2374(-)
MAKSNVPVFEVAWEVCNKVGGIYTVIRSKAPVTCEELGDNYYAIGPVNESAIRTEVEQAELSNPIVKAAIDELRAAGVRIVTGRWLIDGYPQVILFDLDSQRGKCDEWKYALHKDCHIDLPEADFESNNATVFGNCVYWFLECIVRKSKEMNQGDFKAVAHFHEWLVGIGLILARTRLLPIATVFTTHATLLGRYLCADPSFDAYNQLEHVDPDAEAGKRMIYHRYAIEKASAHSAHVFTTVSEITAWEAKYLLQRQPDVVTPNGLNVQRFAALHEFQNLHAQAKEKINQFIRGHFHGHLDFSLDKTLYFFLAGRYEFSNKGCDMFIEALARLNAELLAAKSDVTVIAFIIMAGRTTSFNVEALEGQAVAKQLRDTIADIKDNFGDRLFDICQSGRMPDTKQDELISKEDMVKLKRCVYSYQRHTLPPIVTHNLVDDATDPVLANLRRCQLFNNRHDRVKVIFHPQFLSSTSPLLPLDYDSFVRGCHLGVFPSYYEPWGYTPAECTVMGVPSITSNLAGFGGFIEKHVKDFEACGTYVIDRRFKSPEESVQQLVHIMNNFCKLSRRERIQLRNRTERLSELIDWQQLGRYYTYGRGLAMCRAYGTPAPTNPDRPEDRRKPEHGGSTLPKTPVQSTIELPGETSDLTEKLLSRAQADKKYTVDELRELFTAILKEESSSK